ETGVQVLTPSEGGSGRPLSAPCPRVKQPWDLLYTCKDAMRSQPASSLPAEKRPAGRSDSGSGMASVPVSDENHQPTKRLHLEIW
ncbi:unnamed protein product, partial [Gulo gulo]